MNISKKTLLLIYGIFVILFLWQSYHQKSLPAPLPVRITTDATDYTLPKTPIISLVNTTDELVTVDTCRDIVVVTNGLQKSALPPALCRTIEIPAKTTKSLFGDTKEDILLFQEKFAAISEAHLRFTYTDALSKQFSETELSIGKAGLIRLVFRTLFYNPVYNLFAALIVILPGHSLGWAILVITILIRLILLIPQQKALVSQRKMQTIQPKIQAIQEAHKGDQAAIGMKMMELYKKEWVNPLGSCLPLIIQLPILIVLYQVILNISNPGNLAHLYHFEWLQAFRTISINTDFFGIQLAEHGGITGVILWVLTGGLQFGQMWLSQKKNTKSAPLIKGDKGGLQNMPDMQQMQKTMIYIFPAMAGIFAFQFAAGLALYWLIGTIFMIVQQWFANKQAEEKKITIRDKTGNMIS